MSTLSRSAFQGLPLNVHPFKVCLSRSAFQGLPLNVHPFKVCLSRFAFECPPFQGLPLDDRGADDCCADDRKAIFVKRVSSSGCFATVPEVCLSMSTLSRSAFQCLPFKRFNAIPILYYLAPTYHCNNILSLERQVTTIDPPPQKKN